MRHIPYTSNHIIDFFNIINILNCACLHLYPLSFATHSWVFTSVAIPKCFSFSCWTNQNVHSWLQLKVKWLCVQLRRWLASGIFFSHMLVLFHLDVKTCKYSWIKQKLCLSSFQSCNYLNINNSNPGHSFLYPLCNMKPFIFFKTCWIKKLSAVIWCPSLNLCLLDCFLKIRDKRLFLTATSFFAQAFSDGFRSGDDPGHCSKSSGSLSHDQFFFFTSVSGS